MAININGSALDVAGVAHGDRHFFVFDQVFELDFFHSINDLRAAVVPISLRDLAQLRDDDALQLFIAGENGLQLGDALANLRQFFQDFVNRELRQPVQLQFENGVNLRVAKAKTATRGACSFGEHVILLRIEFYALDRCFFAADQHFDRLIGEEFVQILASIGTARRSANDFDHIVDVIKRDAIAEQDVLAFARLAQFILRAAPNHIDAVLDEILQKLNEAELPRLSADNGEQDHAKRFLHLRHLEELVEDNFRLLIALHFNHDAHPVAIAFVANIGHAFDLLVVDQLSDMLDQVLLVDLIGQLSDDDILSIFAALLDGSLRADLKAAAARFVSLLDAFAAVNVAGRRKIRTGNDLHNLLE